MIVLRTFYVQFKVRLRPWWDKITLAPPGRGQSKDSLQDVKILLNILLLITLHQL